MNKSPIVLVSLATLLIAGATEARDQIRIVGSSTVFPFAAAVAERFGKTTSFKTPIVESTGSGGGLKLFCSGTGDRHPDITNASRRIKASEVKLCASNGVAGIVG
jgi:phosphate transport system substrate-binding protein